MKKPPSKLKQHLNFWLEQGIISQTQCDSINALYPQNQTTRWQIAFSILGSILVVSGLSLVIAHNWHFISLSTKIVTWAFLQLISGCIGWEAYKRQRYPAIAESAFLITSLLPLLGISLVSQIFHLIGDVHSLLLYWLLLITPLPLITRSTASWITWIIAAFSFWTAAIIEWTDFRNVSTYLIFYLFALGGLLISALSALWRRYHEFSKSFIGALLGFIYLSLMIYCAGFDNTNWWALNWLFLFLIQIGIITLGYRFNRPAYINTAFIFIGLIIISLFIRLVGNMLDTGMIFIVGGIITWLVVYLLNKSRKNFVRKLS